MDFYKTLDISPKASFQEIKKAFRVLALKHHPDRCAGGDAAAMKKANEKIQEIIEAYETLRDAKLREAYDARHAQGRQHESWRAAGRAADQGDDDAACYEFDEEAFIRTYRSGTLSREDREKIYSVEKKPWMTPAQKEMFGQISGSEECWDLWEADEKFFNHPKSVNDLESLIRSIGRCDARYTPDKIAQRVSEVFVEHPDYVAPIFPIALVYYEKLDGVGVKEMFSTIGVLAGKKLAKSLVLADIERISSKEIRDFILSAYNNPDHYRPKRSASPSCMLGAKDCALK